MEFNLSNQFVDERVSRLKFDSLVSEFNTEKDEFRKKGIIPLLIDFPLFEFAFLAQKSNIILQNNGVTGLPPIIKINIPFPSLLFTVRIDYSNYDIIAPSLRFINPCTSEEVQKVLASIIIRPDQQNMSSIVDDRFKTEPQNLLLQDQEKRFFVCLRGLREYHLHPQHDGDSWLLYRNTRLGSINDILERLYLYSIHNINY